LTQELAGKRAANLRARFPVLASYVDDFYTATRFPLAFDFRAMPPEWQRAQSTLAAEYERFNGELKVLLLKKPAL
jgi:hypothetical protein